MVQYSFGLPVRADTAVRPYAEDLSNEANSAIVRWQFRYRERPYEWPTVNLWRCHEIRHRGRAWQPSPTRRIRRLIPSNDDGSHQNSKASRLLVRADTAVRPYAEVLHIKPAHRAERGVRRRPEAPAPRQCRQLCKYGSHGRLGGGRRRIPREAKCESPMGYHRKAITFPREGVAALPYAEFGNPTNINSVKVANRRKHITYPASTSTPSAFAAASSCLSSDASVAPRVRARWM